MTAAAVSDDPRWDAVLAKASPRRPFVYAVRTTGVYCRPTCPARTPRRENVAFFDDGAAAEAAGFRPCKRCQPDRENPHADWDDAVARACAAIEAADAPPSLDELAAAAGFSKFHFLRLFRRTLGVTPAQYARAVRDQRVLREPRRRRVRETITVATAPCALGVVLLASTPRGICAIELGNDAPSLSERIRARFPDATFVDDVSSLGAALDAAIRAAAGDDAALARLPIDVGGTAFQQRVWEALRAIPRGERASYAEIAAGLGERNAARAVGNACAANPVALAIPCHRAVTTAGEVHRYRWGVDRKRALLDAERTR